MSVVSSVASVKSVKSAKSAKSAKGKGEEEDEAKKVKLLVRKRGQSMAKVTNTKKSVDTIGNGLTQAQLLVFQKQLNQYYSEWHFYHDQILDLVDDEQVQDHMDKCNTFEEQYALSSYRAALTSARIKYNIRRKDSRVVSDHLTAGGFRQPETIGNDINREERDEPCKQDGVNRVGGRRQISRLSYETKQPKILPHKHYNVTSPSRAFHAAPSGLLAAARQRFWPINRGSIVREVTHKSGSAYVPSRVKMNQPHTVAEDTPAESLAISGVVGPPITSPSTRIERSGPPHNGRSQYRCGFGGRSSCTRKKKWNVASCKRQPGRFQIQLRRGHSADGKGLLQAPVGRFWKVWLRRGIPKRSVSLKSQCDTPTKEDWRKITLPEFRVFAKNIERFYGELDQVLQDGEESDLFADERDAHDMECAAIEGLLQGVNNRIVALSSARLFQPVQVTEQQQFQPPAVPQQFAIPTPLVTSELTGDGDVPEKGETDNPAVAEPKHARQIRQQEKPPAEHQEMKLHKEPEVVGHVTSTSVRGDVDLSSGSGVVVPTPRTEERINGEFDVGRCQPVELGSLLPADVGCEDAESNDPQAVPRPETTGLVSEDPNITTNQAVKDEEARSLQPAGADEVNVEDRSLRNIPAVQEDSATKPSHESEAYSCQLFNANVARSTDRVRAARKCAEKLVQSVIFTINEKQCRLFQKEAPGSGDAADGHRGTANTRGYQRTVELIVEPVTPQGGQGTLYSDAVKDSEGKQGCTGNDNTSPIVLNMTTLVSSKKLVGVESIQQLADAPTLPAPMEAALQQHEGDPDDIQLESAGASPARSLGEGLHYKVEYITPQFVMEGIETEGTAKRVLISSDESANEVDTDGFTKVKGSKSKSKKLAGALEAIAADSTKQDNKPGGGSGGRSKTKGESASRLDRMYTNKSLAGRIKKFETLPVTFSDHHAILATYTIDRDDATPAVGRGYWKINDYLLRDPETTVGFREALVELKKRRKYTNSFSEWWSYDFKNKVKQFYK
ncbi:pol-like protein [Culex quinquefasciatus]|uniref:Pol-like protein n=1 Tax=Culex quinquefasciatus TaxID=7176 RepID=B0XGS8_CULQU|nr:pol-like protein [Culex quinquefasciatus]|eukprot:XP_001868850.1 pol-like protein [Culex quinquefasciatus]